MGIGTHGHAKGCKGGIFLKVKFFGLISTTFEFSRQKDMPFFNKIDILAGQIWLKLKFCLFQIVENPSFYIWGALKRAIFKKFWCLLFGGKFKCGRNH